MLQFALIFLVSTEALGQIPSLGSCPALNVVQEFEIRKVNIVTF